MPLDPERRNMQFPLLFESAPVAYLLLDESGSIQLANLAARRLLTSIRSRVPEEQEFRGKRLTGYFVPQDTNRIQQHLKDAMSKGRSRIEDVNLPKFDRSEPPLVMEASRHPSQSDLVFVVIYESGGSQFHQDELLLAQSESAAAQTAKNRILANLSHELKISLDSILQLADAAEAGRQAGALNALRRTTQTGLRLIEDILDTAGDQQQLSIKSRPFSFPILVEHIRERFQPQAGTKHLVLNCRTSLPKDLLIESDPDRLGQILSNLVQNAVSFTERGRIDLIAAYRPLTEYMGELDLEVRDTGPGIEPAVLRRIWEPGKLRPGETAGTGIGLPLCRKLAKLLGGQIYVKTNVGLGTSVYLNLPVHVRRQNEADTTDADTAQAATNSTNAADPGEPGSDSA